MVRASVLVIVVAGLMACGQAGVTNADRAVPADAAFASMQERGEQAMGVDQSTSTHVFDALPDGGRIELQRDVNDPAGVARIREHLQHIAHTFTVGDFSTPAFVHLQEVPGTAVLAAKREVIRYTYRELPRGGELRIVTQDAQALQAIHEFMSFQRQHHRAGGRTHKHPGGHH
jgi:hypothetical protein